MNRPDLVRNGPELTRLLVKLAKKDLAAYRKLPLAERRRIADKDLKAIGILTKSGRLAPGLS